MTSYAEALEIHKNAVAKPTEAQKEAGNYKKFHCTVHSLPIAIENPKGSKRTGKDAGGHEWSVTMPAHYGYVKGPEHIGRDGDHIDVYLGDHLKSPNVFIVNQIDHKTGKFDEHKCMLGYENQDAALAAYTKAFSDGKGKDRIGSVARMPIDRFKTWLKDGNMKEPARTGYDSGGAVLDALDRYGVNPLSSYGGFEHYDDTNLGESPVTHRSPVLPLAQHQDGSYSYAVPGLLGGAGWGVLSDYAKGNPVSHDRIDEGAVDMAGLAALGSAAVPRPANSIGAFGSAGTGQSAPQSIIGYIRSHGGITDERGDLKSILDRPGRGAKGSLPGIINNKGGLAPDEMRRSLVEAGFIKDPGAGLDNTTINDMHDLIRRAAGGERIVPFHQMAEDAERTSGVNAPQYADEIRGELHKMHADNNWPYLLSDNEENSIINHVKNGASMDDAIYRGIMERRDELDQAENTRRTQAHFGNGAEVPFWEQRTTSNGSSGRTPFDAGEPQREARSERQGPIAAALASVSRYGENTLPASDVETTSIPIDTQHLPAIPSVDDHHGIRDFLDKLLAAPPQPPPSPPTRTIKHGTGDYHQRVLDSLDRARDYARSGMPVSQIKRRIDNEFGGDTSLGTLQRAIRPFMQ